MRHQIVWAGLYGVFIVILLAAVELVHKRLGLRSEITRKIAHFVAAISTLSFPLLFDSHWYALVLAVLFFFLLLLTRKTRYLKSIHDIDRESAGSYLLPLAIYLPFLISLALGDVFLFLLPVLILAVSDPLAGLVGSSLTAGNPEIVIFSRKTRKTLWGSSAFFASSLLISVAAVSASTGRFDSKSVAIALCIAVAATLTELLSPRGTDNLTVPLVVLVCTRLLIHGRGQG